MVTADRQRVIETNRSLRLIKNELESLLEKGVINDSAFDSIQALLPAESSVSESVVTAANRNSTSSPITTTTAAAVPPPSYTQSAATTATGSNAPALPARTPAPSKPALGHARALYDYAGADARDVSLKRDDRVVVLEHMNTDWWMGRNLRTGQEGIFPRSYVQVEEEQHQPPPGPPPSHQTWENEKTGGFPGAQGHGAYQPPAQPVYGGTYPPPPGQVNPYNAHVPPMAVAEQGGGSSAGGSKMGDHGKKFGKKLGNAAIFGAGATIGSNIVNSVF